MSDIEQTHTIETNLYTLHTNMGILCDKVGAGKTLSIVSLLMYFYQIFLILEEK